MKKLLVIVLILAAAAGSFYAMTALLWVGFALPAWVTIWLLPIVGVLYKRNRKHTR